MENEINNPSTLQTSKENIIITWLKKIFSVKVIGLAVSIIGVIFSAYGVHNEIEKKRMESKFRVEENIRLFKTQTHVQIPEVIDTLKEVVLIKTWKHKALTYITLYENNIQSISKHVEGYTKEEALTYLSHFANDIQQLNTCSSEANASLMAILVYAMSHYIERYTSISYDSILQASKMSKSATSAVLKKINSGVKYARTQNYDKMIECVKKAFDSKDYLEYSGSLIEYYLMVDRILNLRLTELQTEYTH